MTRLSEIIRRSLDASHKDSLLNSLFRGGKPAISIQGSATAEANSRCFPILVFWILLSPVLVDDSALHHEHHSAHGGNVFGRIAIESDDVRLQAWTE